MECEGGGRETVILENNTLRLVDINQRVRLHDQGLYKVQEEDGPGWLASWLIRKPVVVSRCSVVHSVDSGVWLCVCVCRLFCSGAKDRKLPHV